MRLARAAALALLGIVLVSSVACSSPPPYTHTTFTLEPSSYGTHNYNKSIYIYANKGQVIEGYWTFSGGCGGGPFCHLLEGWGNPPLYTQRCLAIGWCEGENEFHAKCNMAGDHKFLFGLVRAYCPVTIDLYYSVR